MAAKKTQIAVSELQIGMFVADLDRPWHQTPFPIQGFYIRSADDIRALQSFCRSVYIDRPLTRTEYETMENSGKEELLFRLGSLSSGKSVEEHRLTLPPIKIRRPAKYERQSTLKHEVKEAEKLTHRVNQALDRVFANVCLGQAPDIVETEEVAAMMVESVIRNPDAMLWLSRVRRRDEYAYSHSVAASIWGLVFGRQLGLSRSYLKDLATGLLLSQVGKAKMPQELLQSAKFLDAAQYQRYKGYVDMSVAILKSDPTISPRVVSVVEYHRERHNGSGFPQGVTGDKIPLLAKIAGLVDHYQEMLEPRAGAEAMTSLQAVTALYHSRNIEFQEDLVEKFIQCVGIYPTGATVELSNREVGVVIQHNMERKLWPTVMVLLDEDKAPLRTAKVVDLMAFNIKQSNEDSYLHITHSLPSGAYGIDASRFQVTGANSRWSLRHFMG
ncbi:DUF3391 domain-containing protein [Hahella aquimaris]|uniref:HD-GYP domain-containing protein n=1 Tax=Hahella sp. HNIBRBA332 TaxID=3015983 RepID=UPI00273CBB6B|nr:DUF3391 domain-containing protein [Hahella sp. HNIBRBA332]WLQ17319.1 DUF3391 domain-containing protein [Hahella sp. HNIBRBA332]